MSEVLFHFLVRHFVTLSKSCSKSQKIKGTYLSADIFPNCNMEPRFRH